MMLDMWGEPVHVKMLDKMEKRPMSLDEIRQFSRGEGRWADRMKDLIDQHQEGDTILWYNSPQADWDALMGSRGYALIREDHFVDNVVEAMN